MQIAVQGRKQNAATAAGCGRTACLIAAALLSGCATSHSGPPSDHFNGTRFFNPRTPPNTPENVVGQAFVGLDAGAWPDEILDPPGDPVPERVEDGSLRVTFVNHATVLLQTHGLNILTDPVYADRVGPTSFIGPRRRRMPGIVFDALPRIDVILVSHNHYDHLDMVTLRRLYVRDRPAIIMPLGNAAVLTDTAPGLRATELDWGDERRLSADVTIRMEEAQHWSGRGPFGKNRTLWSAYTIRTPDGPIYYAGDTGFGDGVHFRDARRRNGAYRLALLPIGAYEPRSENRLVHMTPDEAVRAHLALGAGTSLAIHHGTFRLSDEAYSEPVRDLDRAKRRHGVPSSAFLALPNGQGFILPASHGE